MASTENVVLRRRIRARLDALGLAEREASRRAGFSVGYIGDIMSGRSKEPAMPRMIKLARVLECDVDYLIGNQESPRIVKEERGFRPMGGGQSELQRLIDLYSSGSITNDIWVPISAGAVDKVPVIPPLAHVDAAYAWSISSRYMEPRYYIGEVVYLHPGIMPRVGDFVLTKLKAGLVAVVRIAAWDDETVTFEMLNHPDRTCVRRRDEIEFIHRIVGSAG